MEISSRVVDVGAWPLAFGVVFIGVDRRSFREPALAIARAWAPELLLVLRGFR
jgi:hypothetical protein